MTILRYVLLAAALWLPAQAEAETVRVRSGDHPGFSRLVIEFAEPGDWRLGRVDGGYALDAGRPGLGYRLDEVYRLITRARIAEVEQDTEGRLRIGLGCDCHAVAQPYRGSWVIVDIADGPPPAGSPFETALSAIEPGEPSAATAAKASSEGSAPISSGPRFMKPPAPRPFIRQPPAAALPEPSSQAGAGGNGALPSTPAIPFPPMLAEPPAAWLQDARLPSLHPEGVPDQASLPESTGDQEARLLEELARAATQGLLEADMPSMDRALDTAGLSESPPATPDPDPPPSDLSPQAHVRIEAETSLDRDARMIRSAQSVTAEGLACLPDESFDVAVWGSDGDVADGLAGRRAGLVGEFDRPDGEAVLSLARYYLHLGFGAEARATVAAFPGDLPGGTTVEALAAILDGEGQGLPGPLKGQWGCKGRVAMWAMLAESVRDITAPEIDRKAVLAAFSELPLHLRRLLGPELSERFLAMDDHATAVTLRNAIARAPGDHGAAFELLDARLELAEGDTSATERLPKLLGRDAAVAPEAFATYLEAKLAEGQVAPGSADTAAALAFDLTGTDTGAQLTELSALARIAEGNFDGARRGIEDAATEDPRSASILWSRFSEAIAQGAQDATFLRQSFAARADLAAAELQPQAAELLARRLTALGFPEEALRYLPEDAASEGLRMARAEALLASGAPSAAVGALAGLDLREADRLRGEAFLELGDTRGAAQRFAEAGDAGAAERAAWIGGDWDLLMAAENETRALIARGIEAQTKDGENTPAEIAGGPAARNATTTAPRAAQEPARLAAAEADPSPDLGDTAPDAGSRDLAAGGDRPPGGRVLRAAAALAEAREARQLLEALLSETAFPDEG